MRALLAGAATIALLSGPALGQWSAEPGQRVRNAFGPEVGSKARICRGACGVGCPSSCSEQSTFECLETEGLRRVRVYECGTHLGCRRHDDCLDECSRQRQAGADCQAQCHMEALEEYGFESATSWATGGGPYDAEPIHFEYTRDAPNLPEAVYRCPGGSTRRCEGDSAACVAGDGAAVAPVFDRYPPQGAGSIRISGFRSGRVCDGTGGIKVCTETIDIDTTAETRYGFEFSYENADPAVPLVCFSKGDPADEDFIGGLLAGALREMPEPRGGSEAGALLGALQGALSEGQSLKDVLSGIRIDGAGPEPEAVDAAGVPREVRFPARRGRLVVPIREAAETLTSASTVVRQVRCSYRGAPALEATFRLHPTSGEGR